METFLLNLINQKLSRKSQHEVSNDSIRNQLKLAAIDLTRIAKDVAKSLELKNDETLSVELIKERQVAKNITDANILAYFERKEYVGNSLLKLRDRIKVTKQLDEINKDRSFKIKQFQRPLKQTLDTFLTENDTFNLKIDFLKTLRHFSCWDLKDLKKICLKDMTVNKIHFGFYLECTVITKPAYTCGLNFQARDCEDETENIVLFNYEAKSASLNPSVLLPIGTKLIIKEPHLQTVCGSYSDENEIKRNSIVKKQDTFVIRVDSPTDVIVLSFGPCENKTDSNLNQDHLIIQTISENIEKTHDLKSYLKRSKAYFNLEKYTLAYHDALKASLLSEKNAEAYFLMGKSSYSMKKFEIAYENFQNCLKLNPKNEIFKQELEKTNSRILESKLGIYDLDAIIEKFVKKKNGWLYFDIADYMSDKIQIISFNEKSKGIRAIKAIAKGTLLVCSKATSTVFNEKSDYREKGFNRVHLNSNIYEKKDTSVIIANLAYKMQNDPDLAAQIYGLYAGDEYDRENIKQANINVDIMRLEKILSKNSFDSKNYLDAVELGRLQKEYIKQLEVLEFSVNQLDLVDLESLNFESDTYKQLAKIQIKYDNLNQQRGLWVLPSYFNHSCAGNSFHICIGDVMMIYTRRDVNKGEELTLNYLAAEQKYSVRLEKLFKMHQFKCECELCNLDEADSMRDAREILMKKMFAKKEQSISEALADVNRMRCTYLKRPKFQIQMIFPLEILASKYRTDSVFNESAKCYEQIFDVAKDLSEFVSLAALKEAYIDFRKCSEIEKSDACKARASEYFGFFKSYFELVWEKIQLIF